MNDRRIIVALDVSRADQALELADRLDSKRCRLKIGKELFTAAGPAVVSQMVERGFDVFLDLKFHDIPNTVAKACHAAARLGVWMLNVHASGGRAMLQSAREAIDTSQSKPLLIAVTVLTSMDDAALRETGVTQGTDAQVMNLARLTQSCALDGVVCSAQEIAMLRQALPASFKLVTPGIRPLDSDSNDQVRVMTPEEATAAGASYLVIGRPITSAPDPQVALEKILASL